MYMYISYFKYALCKYMEISGCILESDFRKSPGAVSGQPVPIAEWLDPTGRCRSVPSRGGLVQRVGMQPGGPVEPWKNGGEMVGKWRLNFFEPESAVFFDVCGV